MKKIVLIALTLCGAGLASSKADLVISFGGGGYYSRPCAPVYERPYTRHDAYHDTVAQDHGDLHQDLRTDHKQFHRTARRNPSLWAAHGEVHRDLAQDHGDFHHEAAHDHDRFHGYDY